MVLITMRTSIQIILLHVFITYTAAQIHSGINSAVINSSDPIKQFVLENDLLYIRGLYNGYIVNPTGLNVTQTVPASTAVTSQPTYWKRVDETKDEIFDCESNANTCRLRKLSDLSVIGTGTNVGAFPAGTNEAQGASRMIIHPTIYSDTNGAISFFFVVSPPFTKGLSIRNPGTMAVVSMPNPDDFTAGETPVERNYITTATESVTLEFFDIVTFESFQYIFKNSVNDQDNPARIASVCEEDDIKFSSHTEIALACGNDYNYIQSLFVSSKLGGDLKNDLTVRSDDPNEVYVFAVMGLSRTSQDTKLCALHVSKLRQEFQSTYVRCRVDGDQNIEFGPPELNTREDCVSSSGIDGNQSICNIIKTSSSTQAVYNPTPIQMTEIIGLNFTATSMKMILNDRYSVAVMTDAGSSIYQVLLGSSKKGIYRRKDIPTTTPLTQQVEILDSKMYVASNATVFKLNLYSCSKAMNCNECTALQDPFCGWCALSQRCTTSNECQWENETDHWLQKQCINPDNGGIEDLTMSTELSSTGQAPTQEFKIYYDIIPKTTANMPTYQCCFEFSVTQDTCVNATTVAEKATRFYITCKSPQNIRDLLSFNNEQSVKRPLKVVLGNHAFIETEVTYFDCSALSTCTACTTVKKVKDNHNCVWCTNSSVCTSRDIPSCGGVITNKWVIPSEKAGEQYCPRIEPVDLTKTEILIPSGTTPEQGGYSIKFKTQQVPAEAKLTCVLSWALDVRKEYVAIRGTTNEYTCGINDALQYTGNTGTQVATFNVHIEGRERSLDNLADISVLMYKCSEMSDNCGECLGQLQRYKCGWCQPPAATPSCSLEKICMTDYLENEAPDFIKRTSAKQCPDNTIKSFSPYAGPTNGQTVITIEGKNLGQTIDESRLSNSVYIGDPLVADSVACVVNQSLTELPSKIVCVTEGLSKPLEAAIFIKITEPAQSSQNFRFLVPVVKGIDPAKGPVSGGTKVAIYGTNVNIGSMKKGLMKYRIDNRVEELVEAVEAHQKRDLNQIVFLTNKTSLENGAEKKVMISYIVDGFTSPEYEFTYLPDAEISDVVPMKGILSGGTSVIVTGTNLDVVAKPLMYLVSHTSRKRRAVPELPDMTGECVVNTPQSMTCWVPEPPTAGEEVQYDFGFIMDGQTNNLAGKLSGKFEIVANPIIYESNLTIISPDVTQFSPSIKGERLLLIGNEAIVRPMINIQLKTDLAKDAIVHNCSVTSVSEKVITCDLRTASLVENTDYEMTIKYGSAFSKKAGTVRKKVTGAITPLILGIIIGCVVLVVVVVIIIIAALMRKNKQNKMNMQKLQNQMDSLELRVAKECKEAFAELQTDMNEMTHDIANLHGLPFYAYQRYAMKALFPTSSETDHAVVRRLEEISGERILDRRETVERGLKEFGKLITNKTFLLTFIRTLENQRTFYMRDRVDVASLVSVALQNKMEYYTDILKRLLEELIEKSIIAKRDPRILLRRNESVAEKMLSNWFTFLLHKFLKECAGEPLYLLYRAIKQQIDKGPVDCVTSDARYSLSEDKLLRQHVDFTPMTLKLVRFDPLQTLEPQYVKVLSCDTISQVLDKILDASHRNSPYSHHKSMRDTLMIEWVKDNGAHLLLSDDDSHVSRVEGEFKTIATLADYKIPDHSTVCLVQKPDYNSLENGNYQKSTLTKFDSSQTSNGSPSSSLPRINSTNNILSDNSSRRLNSFHLVKHDPETQHLDGDRNKMVSEVYLTRLLSTKGTLQQFVDDLFETIFSTAHRGSALPLAIKHMFDFLDDQASHHNITDPEVIHKWKSNSLPLRFWVNIIKNPDFVFDIHKSDIVDSCLSVVAQIFMESCSRSEQKLDKDSPSSKLLYAKEIPRYRSWVQRYYSDIKSMPAISDQDMAAILAEESRQQTNVFNTTAAHYELYKYSLKYDQELLAALDNDEFARRDNLRRRLADVNNMLNFDHNLV